MLLDSQKDSHVDISGRWMSSPDQLLTEPVLFLAVVSLRWFFVVSGSQ